MSPSWRAMRSLFATISRCTCSSAVRPRVRPPSSAVSMRTSNQDSMERTRNCTETAYTTLPGSSAIRLMTRKKRAVSLAPKTPARMRRTSTKAW